LTDVANRFFSVRQWLLENDWFFEFSKWRHADDGEDIDER